MSTLSDLEKTIGYHFGDCGLLNKALTHSSAQKKDGNNERLEFLGDRVLGLVVAQILYRAFPEDKEGALAKRHAALVQKSALVEVAETTGISPFIYLSSGEVKAGGPRKETILSDAVEALIGALYLDGGFPAAEAFVTRFWADMLKTHSAPPQDAKTALQEWAQARGFALPEYRTISKSGADHSPVFEIEVSVGTLGRARAVASSKRAAEKQAAQAMMEKIGAQE